MTVGRVRPHQVAFRTLLLVLYRRMHIFLRTIRRGRRKKIQPCLKASWMDKIVAIWESFNTAIEYSDRLKNVLDRMTIDYLINSQSDRIYKTAPIYKDYFYAQTFPKFNVPRLATTYYGPGRIKKTDHSQSQLQKASWIMGNRIPPFLRLVLFALVRTWTSLLPSYWPAEASLLWDTDSDGTANSQLQVPHKIELPRNILDNTYCSNYTISIINRDGSNVC